MIMGFTVFDPAVAPRNGAAFRAWHEEQTDWDDTDECLKPTIANQVIQSWYADMVGEFPNLNAAEASSQPTDAAGGDYNFAQHLCYVGFHHNVADVAWTLLKTSAARHGLGTYDPNSDDGRNNRCIVFPEGPLANEASWLSRIFGKNKG